MLLSDVFKYKLFTDLSVKDVGYFNSKLRDQASSNDSAIVYDLCQNAE